MFIVCYSAKFIITAIANTGKDNKTSSKKHTAVISAAVTGTAVAAAKKHHAAKKIILTIKIAFFITFFFVCLTKQKYNIKTTYSQKNILFFNTTLLIKYTAILLIFSTLQGFSLFCWYIVNKKYWYFKGAKLHIFAVFVTTVCKSNTCKTCFIIYIIYLQEQKS